MIAVLTGDIVNSTKMSSDTYNKVISTLNTLFENANAQFNAVGEIYRGDGFQVQYPDPFDAIKSTLLLKLALHSAHFSDKPIQCTLSLAFGKADIYAEKPNTSSGTAFLLSGRGLEKTPRGDLLVQFDQPNDELVLLTQFLNHLLNRLTKSQAELLYQTIETEFTEHWKIAEVTGTSRQNISNRLGNIGAFLVRDYMDMISRKLALLKGVNS